MQNIENEEHLLVLLQDNDEGGRKVLDIIYENSFFELLANEKVQDVIEAIWNGDQLINSSLLSFTSIT